MQMKINSQKNSDLKVMLDSLEKFTNGGITILEQYEQMMEKMTELS
jgi:hypothetical protein